MRMIFCTISSGVPTIASSFFFQNQVRRHAHAGIIQGFADVSHPSDDPKGLEVVPLKL